MSILLDTRTGWLHSDDDTPCADPETCARDRYWPGGRPGFPEH